MEISPITSITPIQDFSKQTQISQSGSDDKSFGNILTDLIKEVNRTDQVSNADTVKLAAGTTDDVHTVMINTEKTEIATLTLVQVRNKILDAYNEIMRVNL